MKTKILAILFTLVLCVSCFSLTANGATLQGRLVDDADLLSVSEEEYITSRLDEVSENLQFDIVIVTVDDTGSYSMQEYADDYYDYNGYGYGSGYDGVLLLVNMYDRDWYVSTCGYGITAITDDGLDYMSEQFVPYLSNGEYEEAFDVFIDECEFLVTQAYGGTPYDTDSFSNDIDWIFLPTGIAAGVVIAFIIVGIGASSLKSVRSQPMANDYIVPGSMQITHKRDLFLYSHVNKVRKESNNGSSTHRSSSGRSHGGGGGGF